MDRRSFLRAGALIGADTGFTHLTQSTSTHVSFLSERGDAIVNEDGKPVSQQTNGGWLAEAQAAAEAAQAAANAGFVFDTEAAFQAANIPLVLTRITVGIGPVKHDKVRISAPSRALPWHSQSADRAWWLVAPGQIITPQVFGAVGDGIADDAMAMESFRACPGVMRFVPPGIYREGAGLSRFDAAVLGNGVFNDSTPPSYSWGYWGQVWGDRQRDSLIVHGRTVDANDTILSPAIKTQTKVTYTNMAPKSSRSGFTQVGEAYHELIGEGVYNIQTDANNNFTCLGATAHNKFAGLFGMTAITGRVWDATEAEVPAINTYGASKSFAGYFPFVRRSKFVNGGYMGGLEVYAQNTADEADDIPYRNSDSFSFEEGGGWTAAVHLTMLGGDPWNERKGAPISAGILIDRASNAPHGSWNGIVIGGSAMRINGRPGVAGTVGLTFASWSSKSYGDICIKYRVANRHHYYREGAKIRTSLTRQMFEAGATGYALESQAGNSSYLSFRDGATTDPSPTVREHARITGGETALLLSSLNGTVQLVAGSSGYTANASSFAPNANNARSLGRASNLWTQLYANSGTINTSDEREKSDIAPITDALLDAWGDVRLVAYRWIESVAAKGDLARVHHGVIAQQVRDALAAHGIDGTRYGLLCYDEWEAQPERVEVSRVQVKPEVYEQIIVKPGRWDRRQIGPEEWADEWIEDELGDGPRVIEEAVYEEARHVTLSGEAGRRWGIREGQCLFVEAAYQRREASRAKERLASLEARVAALEAASSETKRVE
jgi:hypothetical protein